MNVGVQTRVFRAPRWLKRHETLLAIILVIALIGLGAFNDRFLTVDNLLNQGRLMTEIGLIALPMTFVIITGGIDISVGAIVGLCAIMLGYSWKTFGFPLPLAIAFSLFVGALAGFVNGLVITRVKVPPLIMTIATLALYRGLAEGVSQAHSVRGYPEWFYFLGQGSVFGVPAQLLLLVVLIVIAGVALDRTTFGRTLYAIGANETAARFSALPVDRVKLIVYTLSGLASGLAAWVLVSRVTTTRMDRRHRRGGARRCQHLWRRRHDLGNRDRSRDDPTPQERSGVDGGQGRRDNRRHRRRAHSFGAHRKLARASPGLTNTRNRPRSCGE
jgi:rhamnose transport system permease protein